MKPSDLPPATKAVCCDDLFADYDAAAERLAEAREILALNPTSNPAQERVDDALKRVAYEIGKWIERTRSANSVFNQPVSLNQ